MFSSYLNRKSIISPFIEFVHDLCNKSKKGSDKPVKMETKNRVTNGIKN